MSKRIVYAPGDMIGGFEFIGELPPAKTKRGYNRRIRVYCHCGGAFDVLLHSIKCGNTKSCGCVTYRSNLRHGLVGNKVYNAWRNQKNRCHNPNNYSYKWYGARGIKMSDEFRNSFAAWYEYVGSLPGFDNRDELGLTIDRINNDGDYERGNMRWATKEVQAMNKRMPGRKISEEDAVKIKHLKSIGVRSKEIASQFGISRRTVNFYITPKAS